MGIMVNPIFRSIASMNFCKNSFISMSRIGGLLGFLLVAAGPALPQDENPVRGAADAVTQVHESTLPRLFSADVPGMAADSKRARDRQVVRWREVSLDTALLTGAANRGSAADGNNRAIALNLFDNVSFIADLDRIEHTARGVNWFGHLRGVDMSQVVLVVQGDVVAGNITMPMARYHIRFVGNGVHEVQRIDPSLFPADEPSTPIPDVGTQHDASFQPVPGAQADDGSTIDVMIVYTATTRAAAGGTASMQSLMDLAIAETNQSYLNSGVTQRLRLVHTEEVNYAEDGSLDNALQCITSTSDGCLDNVHALRDTYGADMVSFWVENGGGYCGLGWLMSTVSSSFADHAFSAVARSCATGYYSFGHELGHNMGARHDVYVDSATTPYPYAHGYTNAAAASPWRTIMAYNDACASVGKNCNRIQYWANPAVSYNLAPMGNATADDHQALNNTALTVANFRPSVGTCSYALSVAGQSIGAAATTGSVTVTAGAACPWTAVSNAAWLVVTSGASGSGNGSVGYSVAANTGGSPRSATITIAGQTITINQGFDDAFPSGGTLPAGWTQPPGSSAPWAVSGTASYGGASSIKSGVIGNSQTSAIQVGGMYKTGNVSFFYKVDSEPNYDFLKFYIDGVQRDAWSGTLGWTAASYPVAKGYHVFRWEYVKDTSVASGSDAAWIDDVVLPEKSNANNAATWMLLLD